MGVKSEAGLTLGDLVFNELKKKGALEKDLTAAAAKDATPGR
jgi:hypothetical protein